jgi:hypothetical protein
MKFWLTAVGIFVVVTIGWAQQKRVGGGSFELFIQEPAPTTQAVALGTMWFNPVTGVLRLVDSVGPPVAWRRVAGEQVVGAVLLYAPGTANPGVILGYGVWEQIPIGVDIGAGAFRPLLGVVAWKRVS